MWTLCLDCLSNCREWKESLEKISSLGPEHISAYSLILEEETAFHKLYEKNKLFLPSEEEEREMYQITKDILNSYGYKQYEISNYSKEGYECYHNKVYWRSEEYIGLGSSSASFIDGKRIKNVEDVKTYIEKINNEEAVADEIYQNTKEDNMEEFMFMGLRLIEGIKMGEFKKRFNLDITEIYKEVIEKNISTNLLEIKGGNLRLTEKGIELSNYVMSDFILE